VKEKLADIVRRAVKGYLSTINSAPPEELDTTVQAPKNAEFGDYSTSVAFALARTLKRPPIEIARGIVAQWPPKEELVQEVTIAEPGFVNIRLNPKAAARTIADILEEGDLFGCSRIGAMKKAQVEFVSANPTGPLHIGHARNAIAGDTIARILEAAGYDVTREYYFNDAGGQMARLGESLRARYLQLVGRKAELPEDGYKGEYLTAIAKKLRKEKGDKVADKQDLEFFTKRAVDEILKMIEEDLEALDIEFDVWSTESSMYADGHVERTLDDLRRRKMTYIKDGAEWLRSMQFGDEKDRVLIKSDGAMTYLVPDIAYHDQKIKRGFDLLVDILGADHHGYIPRLAAGLQALGHDPKRLRPRIYQMVTLVRDGQEMKISTREGDFVTLKEMVEELGSDVVRFFFLMRELDSHLLFDWDLAKKTDWNENPVYYVQYAHARICSIFAKAAEKGYEWEGLEDAESLERLTLPEEQALIKQMYNYQDVVERAARLLEPQGLTAYVRDLAATFHNYFTRGTKDPAARVIQSHNKPLMQARFALITAVQIVLRNAFGLLGIEAPEEMERLTAQ
jgi:arginyl-tRNA synthetase